MKAFDFLEKEEEIVMREEQEWREKNTENIHIIQDAPLTEEESWREYTSELSEFLTSDSEEKSLWDDWYNQRSFLFTCLSKVGDQQAVDFALNFFQKSPENIYRNDVADLCSKVDVGYSADRIIELINSGDVSRYDKYDYSRMLYRLELGCIGISEEGVQYLGKKFDLGVMNSSNNYIRRLTSAGDIAVFNQDEKMTGTFNTGDLTDNTKVVRPEVLDVTYDLLFEQKVDESEEERQIKNSILKEFTDNYYSFYDQDFLKDTSIHVNNLTMKEQGWFMHYTLQVSEKDDLESLTNFVRRYGENGFRTFLSLERGDESLGDKIVEFGQNKEVARKVFSYYGELLDSADEADKLVRKVSACEGDTCSELEAKVRENILNRAQKDLERVVRSNDASEIEVLVGGYVAEAKEYVALLQEVEVGNIEILSAVAISAEDKEQMSILLKTNFERICPDPEDEDFRRAVSESLQQSFVNEGTDFNILRDKEKIISFNRFDTLRDGEVSYLGSFNVDPAYSGVGEIMLNKALDKRLENGQTILAHADPDQPITKKYINEGFVATGLMNNYAGSDRTIFEIWRTGDIKDELKSKAMSVAELLKSDLSYSDVIVRELAESDDYIEVTQGKALTRYFDHEEKTYVVFEKLPAQMQSNFSLELETEKEAA